MHTIELSRARPNMIDIQAVKVAIRIPSRWSDKSQERVYDLVEQVDVYAVLHEALTEKFKRYGVLQNVTIEVTDL